MKDNAEEMHVIPKIKLDYHLIGNEPTKINILTNPKLQKEIQLS
jgi:hypothetical protein